jgi:K+-transporting ATPase ATPase A chain
MVMLSVLVVAGSILLPAAVSSVLPMALKQLGNPGAHGLSEILYAYTSASANNGSAFAGISPNVPWFNVSLGLSMLFGRFLMIVPLLAVAGSLAQKKMIPASAGTLPTTGPLFVVLLAGVVLIVGALTFFPALALGPIVEHFQMIGR